MSAKAVVSPSTGYLSRSEAESRERVPVGLAAAYWPLAAPQFLALHLVRPVAGALAFIALFAVLAPIRVSRVSFGYLLAVAKWWLEPDASASILHAESSPYRSRRIANHVGGAVVTFSALAIPVVAALAALPYLLDAQSTSQARNHGNAGLALYYEGQVGDAIKEFDKAIELNPGLASAHVARAAAYGDLGESQLSLADANTAIELDPNLAGAYVNRARAYLQLGYYPAALADTNAAIDIDPNLAEAYLQRANAHTSLGNYQDALDDSHRAIELNPDFAPAHVIRGLVYSAMGEPEFAVNDWQAALSLTDDPDSTTQIERLINNVTPTP